MDSIFIVVAFFIAVSLLSIPCMMYYKKKEKKEHQLISENRDQAVLQIYGDPIRIDGKVFSEYEHMGSKLSYYTVVLPEAAIRWRRSSRQHPPVFRAIRIIRRRNRFPVICF